MQIDNGHTYENRALAYTLQQSAQESNPLSTIPARKPTCYKSDLQEARLLSLVTTQETKP